MKKKILLLVVLVVLLTGCGSSKMKKYEVDYSLNISDVFEESITVGLPKDAEKKVANEDKKDDKSYSLEYYFLEMDQNPIFSDFDELYRKNIEKYDNLIEVTLDYNYIEKSFVYSNYITTCFSSYDVKSGDDYFEINLSGNFSCGKEIDKLNINISTDYKVTESNGKKNDDAYSWSFDSSDFDKIDLKYKVARDYEKMAKEADNSVKKDNGRKNSIRNLRIAVVVLMVIVIIVFAIRFYFMKKDAE